MSSSIAVVTSQDKPPAAKRLRSSLGLIHDKNKFGVANQNQQSISQLVDLHELLGHYRKTQNSKLSQVSAN